MRRGLAILGSAALLGVFGIIGAGGASADPPFPCPDGHVPVHESMVPSGEQKDKNGNDLVCAKPITNPNGGPDDNEFDPNSVIDDII